MISIYELCVWKQKNSWYLPHCSPVEGIAGRVTTVHHFQLQCFCIWVIWHGYRWEKASIQWHSWVLPYWARRYGYVSEKASKQLFICYMPVICIKTNEQMIVTSPSLPVEQIAGLVNTVHSLKFDSVLVYGLWYGYLWEKASWLLPHRANR